MQRCLQPSKSDQVFKVLFATGPDMKLAGGFLDDGIESVLGSEPHGFYAIGNTCQRVLAG
jgi:hypothetical protein